jgi:hypothetical protein
MFAERADISTCYVMCNNCGARGPYECQDGDDEETPGEAAAWRGWNRRPSSERETTPSQPSTAPASSSPSLEP